MTFKFDDADWRGFEQGSEDRQLYADFSLQQLYHPIEAANLNKGASPLGPKFI